MARASKKRHLAALKGWHTRRHNLRSQAARKGWRTRHKHGNFEGLLIRSGYESRTDGNSYTLVVRIQRKRKEKYQDVSNRIEKLAGRGYFDEWAEELAKTLDLRWATFHNRYTPLSRMRQRKRKRAVLVGFERQTP